MARGTHRQPARDAAPLMTRSESVAVIETCLKACISAVLHARDILPNKAYTHEKIDFGNETAEYVNLQRGTSTRATHLLGWLDTTFQSLRRGDLSAIQICILADSKRRNHTLETYTFTIHYAPGKDSKPLPAGISLDNFKDESMIVDRAGRDLVKTIQAITAHCETLPDLPKTRFLSMNLFLLPKPTVVDSIEGFSRARRDHIMFPRHAGWQRQTEAFSTIGADHHSTRFKISYMAPQHQGSHDEQPDMAVLQNYMQSVAIVDDIDFRMTKIMREESTGPTPSRSVRKTTRQDPSNGDDDEEYTPYKSQRASSRRQSDVHLDTEDFETQAAAAQMKTALNGMAQSEELTQGDTQAASFLLPEESLPDDLRLQYSNTADNAQIDHSAKRTQARNLAKEIGGLTRSGQIILCQCGYSKEEGEMIRCSICQTWQHSHCYGYIGKEDPRRPAEHLCYVCFLDPREQRTLVQMIEIALARRAAFRAVRYGVAGKADFAEKLGMDSGIAHPLFDQLKDDSHIVAASGSHKAGFKTSGKPTWVPAGGDNYGQMLDKYFNPTSLVEKYFRPYTIAPSRLADQLIIQPALELPVAATPIAEKRKRPVATSKLASNTPQKDQQVATPGTYGTTRRGSTYKPTNDSESQEESEEEQPVSKSARKTVPKREQSTTVEDSKLINLESIRLIDVASSSKDSRKI